VLERMMVVPDPRLVPLVESELVRGRAGRRGRARNILVLCGPPSVGKRRFAEAAAAALGRPLYRIRASSLMADLDESLLGSPALQAPARRGLFVDARLATGSTSPVIHIDGLEATPSAQAEMLTSLLTDM